MAAPILGMLNVLDGSDPAINPTIAAANDLLSSVGGRLPLKIKPNSSTGSQMVGLAATLDSYNND